jgi:hypothetical protein
MNIKKLSIPKIKKIIQTLRFMRKENIVTIKWERSDQDIFMLDWSDTQKSITLNPDYLYYYVQM